MELITLSAMIFFIIATVLLTFLLGLTPIHLMLLYKTPEYQESKNKLKKAYLRMKIPYVISGIIIFLQKPEFLNIIGNNIINQYLYFQKYQKMIK